MKPWKKIILFVLVVSIGIFIIDCFLFAIPGKDCNCFDSQLAHDECWAVCLPYDGCDFAVAYFPGYCASFYICCTRVVNYCNEGMKAVYARHCVWCETCESD